MPRVVLQIPIDKQIRQQAEKAASKMGFSSLQEYIRVNLSQLINNQIEMVLREPDVRLSLRSEKRYAKITKDFEEGKNITVANSVDELMDQLHDLKKT